MTMLILCHSPEWGRKEAQILNPGETYTWEASWTFGVFEKSKI